MIAYLDTSALLRVLVVGPGTAELARRTQQYLDRLVSEQHTIVSSVLIRTEVLCQANRQPEIDVEQAERAMSLVNLVAIDSSDLEAVPATAGRLRTLDAIHLTVALGVGADLMVAYDEDLRRAAQLVGMRVGPDPVGAVAD